MTEDIVGQINTFKSVHEWTIDNFNSICKNLNVGDMISSSTFSIKHQNTDYKWQLVLYPLGCSISYKNFLSFGVCNYSDSDCTANISCSLSVNNTVVQKLKTKCPIPKGACNGFSRFFKNTKNDILNQQKIIIRCFITNFDNNNTKKEETQQENNEQHIDPDIRRLRILDEYESLIGDQEFSDVTFTLEDKTIHAHKCILVKSSPVFNAMFQHRMKEKQENTVEIKDISYEVFVEMLKFMYVGKVDDIDKIAADLLIAADKYGLDILKKMCEESLSVNMSVYSAVENLKLADLCRVDQLKADAIEFIVEEIDDFINKPEFKQLTATPELLFEVCQAMTSKMF